MSNYNNNRFTPGNKANLKQLLQKEFIKQYYKTFNSSQTFDNINNADDITEGTLCGCIQQRVNLGNQGYNDTMQTENRRVSQILTNSLGGKITYGTLNRPIILNYLGGSPGQPGGIPRPIRNSF
jgi:hypothetical protein